MSAVTNAENAPHTIERREDGVIAEQERYLGQLNKMKQNESKFEQKSPEPLLACIKEHTNHHYDPKITRKANQSGPNQNLAAPDKFEILREENLHLRSTHNNLEEQVRIIQSKLQRQITML